MCTCDRASPSVAVSGRVQEYKEATKQKTSDTGITLIPNETNLFVWRALLQVRWPTAALKRSGRDEVARSLLASASFAQPPAPADAGCSRRAPRILRSRVAPSR